MQGYNGFSAQERQAANDWLRREVLAGRRNKPACCMACGQRLGILDFHTEDYAQPYGDHVGQFSLCYPCHMMVHWRQGAALAWRRYVQAVEGRVSETSPSAGTFQLYVPFVRREFAQFKRRLLDPARQLCESWVFSKEASVRPNLLTAIGAGRYAPAQR